MKIIISNIRETKDSVQIESTVGNIDFTFSLTELQDENIQGFNFMSRKASFVVSMSGIAKPFSIDYWAFRKGTGKPLPWVYEVTGPEDEIIKCLSARDRNGG